MEDLIYEVRGAVAWLTLNRPQTRNALTTAMYDGIADACARAGADDKVRAMVIQGAGDKAFASGTDIAHFTEFTEREALLAYEKRVARTMEALDGFAKPLIAAVHGACTGGGVGIAAACDLRLGTADARVGVPIARTLGNCMTVNSIVRLSSILGQSRVVEMVFTARIYTGTEAKEAGFFNELLEGKPQLDARAAELAETVAGMAPLTLRATKEQVRRLRAAAAQGVDSRDLADMCFFSADFQGAVRAFLDKRKPVWQGR